MSIFSSKDLGSTREKTLSQICIEVDERNKIKKDKKEKKFSVWVFFCESANDDGYVR